MKEREKKRVSVMNGEIFNIQKFCVNDGPGIRTTVFFKGCPLKCIWCHNPESQSSNKQILFYEHKCVGCGNCLKVPVESEEFFCPGQAKELIGKTTSSEEVVAEVMKDVSFYETSGGGVTLSGGEPLFQFEFAVDVLKKCKEKNLHTAVETCGFASKEQMREISKYTDLFLFDFKEMDPGLHKEYTGVDNCLVLENLQLLNELKKDIILRCPIIPGYNDRKENYDAICELANAMSHIIGIEIEPYHSFGEGKYIAMGKQKPEICAFSDEKTEELMKNMAQKTRVSVRRA